MISPVISVENLSKRYVIGHQRAKGDGLRHRIEAAARAPWRWLKAKAEGRRAQSKEHGVLPGSALSAPGSLLPAPPREEFWALKDVSFEVKQGEVVGIIGRNGAGKSTLLKILSRITEPTDGRVRIKGRVASLLEVGTGFHPELTGRENIYLNGAILGMSKAEIRGKFDEIVAFSEIEKFLDTPVKRYSSGMYVRLAFAVAAHLEPEILIVDEVLAVGDVEFQRKCLGKMREVSRVSSRIVLFVSHNMAAIKSLTTRALLLERGQIAYAGRPEDAITNYLDSQGTGSSVAVTGHGEHSRILNVEMLDAAGVATSLYTPGHAFCVRIVLYTDGTSGLSLELLLVDSNLNKLALASLHQFHGRMLPPQAGTYVYQLHLAPLLLASGKYGIDVTTSLVNKQWDHYVDRALSFQVPFSNPTGLGWDFKFAHGFGAHAWLLLNNSCSDPAPLDNEPELRAQLSN